MGIKSIYIPWPHSVSTRFFFDKRPPDMLARLEAIGGDAGRLLGLDGCSGVVAQGPDSAQATERLDAFQIHHVDIHIGHGVGSADLK